MKINPKLGRTIYRHFETFSWIFLILTLVTLFFVGQGLYFYALYGNCNGSNSNQFCIFDPLGTNKPAETGTSEICAIPGLHQNKTLTAPSISHVLELDPGAYRGNPDAKVIIVEFGCYSYHYTKLVSLQCRR